MNGSDGVGTLAPSPAGAGPSRAGSPGAGPSDDTGEAETGRATPVDARLVPLAVTAWLCTLVVPVVPQRPVVVAAVLFGVLAMALVLLDRRLGTLGGVVSALAVVCAGGAVFGVLASAHVAVTRSGPIPVWAAEAAVVTADVRIRTDPLRRESRGARPDYVVVDADVVRVTRRGVSTRVTTPVVLTGSLAWSQVQPGSVVRTVARLAATEPGERPAAVLSARSPPTLVEEAGWLQRGASRLRAGLRAAVAGLPPPERGLVPALVVGDESRMLPSLVDDFRTAGLSHLTAVSGTNFTIVLAFVLGAARWVGLRSWGLPALGVLCAVGFVILARPEPSVLRAAAMGLVGLAGLAAGWRRYGLPALAIAVIGLLVLDPWLGRSFGFALSVLATAGILVLAPPCTDALSQWLPRFAAAAVAVPVAAQLACTPVVAVLSGSVSVVAVVANLVAAPAVVPATVLGLVATLLAPLSVGLAQLPGRLAGYAARWIVEVATLAADAPGAGFAWPASGLAVTVLVLLCAAAALAVPALLRRRLLCLTIAVATVAWMVHPVRVPSLGWVTGWPPPGWILAACDVGQGDALVLRAGPGAGVVIDTGPDPALVDGCLTDLGITQVPYVLLTHFHADHVAGLPGVLRGRSVGEIGLRPHADAGAGAVDDARRVRTWAAGSGAEVTQVAAGEQRRAGAVRWTVLGRPGGTRRASVSDGTAGHGSPGAPARDGEPEEDSAENDASVVVRAEVHGVRVLLTGDIEPPGQRALLRSGADLRASVLKVPHHGSRYQDPEFVAAVDADLALISAGVDNDYGHPAVSTLRALTSEGTVVGRTDLAGALAVVRDGDELALLSRGRPG